MVLESADQDKNKHLPYSVLSSGEIRVCLSTAHKYHPLVRKLYGLEYEVDYEIKFGWDRIHMTNDGKQFS